MQTVRPAHLRGRRMRAHRGIAYGLVAPLFEHGARSAPTTWRSSASAATWARITSTKLKVTGIDLFSAGDFMGGDGTEEIVLSDPFGGVYKKLVIEGRQAGRRRACTATPSTAAGTSSCCARAAAIARHPRPADVRRVEPRRHRPRGPEQGAPAMADDDEVCGCNGVCKGTIVQGDQGQGPVHARRGAQAHQGQSRSCGSCTGLVEQILMFTAGGDYSAAPKKKAMCGCTDRSHAGSARRDPRRSKLLTIADAMQRPRVAHAQRLRDLPPGAQLLPDLAPGRSEAQDDPQTRFINERAHANIQKDGTYSVMPRMWGGETNGRRAAPHRRRGRQVQDPDRQGHRRPAHRPARREEGRPAGASGRTSACRRATPTPRRCAR